jgi:hypothetical protein
MTKEQQLAEAGLSTTTAHRYEELSAYSEDRASFGKRALALGAATSERRRDV